MKIRDFFKKTGPYAYILPAMIVFAVFLFIRFLRLFI